MTQYRLVYELSNRVREVEIWACSPLEAFKKFKEMMPEIVYKNLAVKNVDEIKSKISKQQVKLCYPCEFKIA